MLRVATVDAVHLELAVNASLPEVLAALGHEPVALDDLLERLGADAGELGGRLLGLELAGLVAQLPGGRVQRIWHQAYVK